MIPLIFAFIVILTMGRCQNAQPNNGAPARVQSQQSMTNGQKFFVVQRDTNVLDGSVPSASSVQFGEMGGVISPRIGPPQFSQNFASPSMAQSQQQQAFVALQQPQTFIPQQQNRMPMQEQVQQQFINRGMTSQFVQRQGIADPSPMFPSPQSTDDDVPCPQPMWKEAMEKAIVANDANASTDKVQKALSSATRGTFIVACAPADRREAFQKKLRLSASGNNFCHVIRGSVWCQALAMNLGKGISLGMAGRRR